MMKISSTPTGGKTPTVSNRRLFFGQIGGVAATLAAGAIGTPSVAAAQPDGNSDVGTAIPAGVRDTRLIEAFNLRVAEAAEDALAGAATNVNNGDEAIYPDKCGAFTKGLPHDSFGRVDLTAYQAFKRALSTGEFSEFESMDMGGGGRTMNGPQGGLAVQLESLGNVQFGQPIVPPAPVMASDQSATELLEHYWASLLRDVAFSDYDSSALATMAAAELSGLPAYLGPRDSLGQV